MHATVPKCATEPMPVNYPSSLQPRYVLHAASKVEIRGGREEKLGLVNGRTGKGRQLFAGRRWHSVAPVRQRESDDRDKT